MNQKTKRSDQGGASALNEIKQRVNTRNDFFFVISFHESIIAKKSIIRKQNGRPARVAEAAELGIFK